MSFQQHILGAFYLIISVVAAVIYNFEGEILLARRPLHKHLGGFWEFPGGKIEINESPLQALKRELFEELGILINEATFFMETRDTYLQDSIHLSFWQVKKFLGEPQGKEGQAIQWVKPLALNEYSLPPANQEVITKLMKDCIKDINDREIL